MLMPSVQNLSFGPTNTMPSASIQSPAIHMYSSIRPHHHLPSLILRSIPIFLVADAMPSVFLSSAAAVASSEMVSSARDLESAREDCFSAVASESIESVSCAWVVESDSSNVAAVGVAALGCAEKLCAAVVENGDVGSKRERRVDVVSVCELEGGVRRSRVEEDVSPEERAAEGAGASSLRRSSSDLEDEE